MKNIIQTPPTSQASSQGIISGNVVFISGQIGNDPISGILISTDIETETRQVMENIRSILSVAKIGFPNVVKTSIYLINMNDLEKVNKIYSSYFFDNFPACEIFEASALRSNAHVEISMIASIK